MNLLKKLFDWIEVRVGASELVKNN